MFKKLILAFILLTLAACGDKDDKKLVVGLSSDYPPFEFMENGQLAGLDVELATELGKKLGKNIEFKDMAFGNLIPALNSGQIDMAISNITSTPQRRDNLDFTHDYYKSKLSYIYNKTKPLTSDQLPGARLGAHAGSTMETYIKTNYPAAQLTVMATNNMLVEALKAGQIDALLIDEVQAHEFVKQSAELTFATIGEGEEGNAIAFKKGSKLTAEVDKALLDLEEEGALKALEAKWIK